MRSKVWQNKEPLVKPRQWNLSIVHTLHTQDVIQKKDKFEGTKCKLSHRSNAFYTSEVCSNRVILISPNLSRLERFRCMSAIRRGQFRLVHALCGIGEGVQVLAMENPLPSPHHTLPLIFPHTNTTSENG